MRNEPTTSKRQQRAIDGRRTCFFEHELEKNDGEFEMRTAYALLVIAYLLLLGAFIAAFPYAKRGYDDMVIERAGVQRDAHIGEAIIDAPVMVPSKPRGMK